MRKGQRGMSVLCAHIVHDTNNVRLVVSHGVYIADRKVLVIIRRGSPMPQLGMTRACFSFVRVLIDKLCCTFKNDDSGINIKK